MSYWDPAASTAAQTSRLARSVVAVPQWWTGTAQSVTDEDGLVEVLVDGPDAVVDEEDTSTDDPNQPVLVGCPGIQVAPEQRVLGVTLPNGSAWVMGSPQGQPFLLGTASIAGGTADQSFTSVAQQTLVGMTVEVEILHPDHLIGIDVNAQIVSGGAANALTGRVIRTDEDGAAVEIGRFLRNSAMASGQDVQVGPRVIDYDVEPGTYSYSCTVQATVTGFTFRTTPGTTPQTAASTTVCDLGPKPTSTFRT